jgi:hypothetical protein
MTRRALIPIPVICIALLPASAFPADAVRRFALVTAANDGGPDRPPLQYALSDAERFARVMAELGGVSPDDAFLLKQPKLKELEEALDLLEGRVRQARRPGDGGRTELLFYYSGHADDKGLLLGEDRYSYRSLRDRLDEVPADVRIAVLDACASGAITRLKGGEWRRPFLVDESADMRGHAFLTSSAESEAAQESDRIRASYFTHYLVSGLRGAADVTGEGKVTLNEAYQFAFSETVGRTVETKGGAQHPSYDINLSGTGEVVITDLRQTSATLVLGEELDGRFFIRNAKRELVIELYKPYGRRAELGVEPGSYEVHVERAAAAFLAKPTIADGARVVLGPGQFTPTTPEATRARGGFVPPALAVTGRNRFELYLGTWRAAGASEQSSYVIVGADTFDLAAGLQYNRFLREDLALSFGARVLGSTSSIASHGVTFSGTFSIVSLPLGVRWNPMKGELHTRAVKPYLAVSLGPVIGSSTGSGVDPAGEAFSETRTRATVGGIVGAGVAFHLGRHFSLGVDGGYQWMADFSDYIAARDNYSGFQLGLTIGWLFGKGSPPLERGGGAAKAEQAR